MNSEPLIEARVESEWVRDYYRYIVKSGMGKLSSLNSGYCQYCWENRKTPITVFFYEPGVLASAIKMCAHHAKINTWVNSRIVFEFDYE